MNRRQPASKAAALPDCAHIRINLAVHTGLEPVISRLTTECIRPTMLMNLKIKIGVRGRIRTGIKRSLQSRTFPFCQSLPRERSECFGYSYFYWQQRLDSNQKYVSQSHVCYRYTTLLCFGRERWIRTIIAVLMRNAFLPIKLSHDYLVQVVRVNRPAIRSQHSVFETDASSNCATPAFINWYPAPESNWEPPGSKPGASANWASWAKKLLVHRAGFEPTHKQGLSLLRLPIAPSVYKNLEEGSGVEPPPRY